jgi:pimeloyl-ACP methyl ester carboxylesterase
MSNVNLSETAPTQFQNIGDVSLAYRHFGKEGAPPVVCFQHFTGTMNNFDPIHTNRLAQDRPVILVDYRGVGRSGGEMPDSMPATAADIIAFVKALGLKEIDLFGFSIGGMVAQQVVLDAPELVRRILLAGTGPSGGEGMGEFTPEVQEIVNRPNSTRRNARWTCSFRRARRVTRRARPGSSGSPRESWTANQKRSPRSPRPSSSLLLNGVQSPRQTATAI